jgi:hypothetical protein
MYGRKLYLPRSEAPASECSLEALLPFSGLKSTLVYVLFRTFISAPHINKKEF